MRRKPKLWISRPTFDDLVAPLSKYFRLSVESTERVFSPGELVMKLADCEAAIVGVKDRIGPKELVCAARLRIVASMAAGYDNLDLDALASAHIAVTNVSGGASESVADFAWLLILAASRRLGEAERWVRAGHWQQPTKYLDWLGTDVCGRTLGVLGLGRIGQAVARRAIGFGMSTIYNSRTRADAAVEQACAAQCVDMTTLLRQSDALVLTLPLTPHSRHIIGRAELAIMKSTAVVVNVSRGGIIDDVALVEALEQGRIGAAGLDVFESEPFIHQRLMSLNNVVLSPHIASATMLSRRAMVQAAIENVMDYFGLGAHSCMPPDLLT